jgi:hypothetical protein
MTSSGSFVLKSNLPIVQSFDLWFLLNVAQFDLLVKTHSILAHDQHFTKFDDVSTLTRSLRTVATRAASLVSLLFFLTINLWPYPEITSIGPRDLHAFLTLSGVRSCCSSAQIWAVSHCTLLCLLPQAWAMSKENIEPCRICFSPSFCAYYKSSNLAEQTPESVKNAWRSRGPIEVIPG